MSETSSPFQPLQPSDNLIRGEVVRALQRSGYPTLCHVTVKVHSGRVCLAGRVSSWHLRQVAETTAMSVQGVAGVESSLDVD